MNEPSGFTRSAAYQLKCRPAIRNQQAAVYGRPAWLCQQVSSADTNAGANGGQQDPPDRRPGERGRGWFDAGGGYEKFAYTASYTDALMLLAARDFPGRFPTLRGEAAFGLNWIGRTGPGPSRSGWELSSEAPTPARTRSACISRTPCTSDTADRPPTARSPSSRWTSR